MAAYNFNPYGYGSASDTSWTYSTTTTGGGGPYGYTYNRRPAPTRVTVKEKSRILVQAIGRHFRSGQELLDVLEYAETDPDIPVEARRIATRLRNKGEEELPKIYGHIKLVIS